MGLVIHCAHLLSLRLSPRHSQQLPGSCFEKNDGTLVYLSSRTPLRVIASEGVIPSTHRLTVTIQFRALLTGLSACFSVFAHATSSLSVSDYYLGLGVDTPMFIPQPCGTTLRTPLHCICTYEAITLYGAAFQLLQLVQWIVGVPTSPLHYCMGFRLPFSAFSRSY